MSAWSRRRFLQGTAAALPLGASGLWMPASAGGPGVQRLVILVAPNGHHLPLWQPTGIGRDYRLAAGMAPLEAIREEVLLVSNLSNRGPIYPLGIDHPYLHAALLTGSGPSGRATGTSYDGWSVDQVVADRIGAATAFPSIQLASEAPRPCHAGEICSLYAHLSWRGRAAPQPPSLGVAAAYARLFGGAAPAGSEAERAAHARAEARVFDLLHQHARRYEGPLAEAEARRLDAYLGGLAGIEARQALPVAACDVPTLAVDAGPADPTSDARAMAELLVASLACDRTRVAVWSLGSERSDRSLAFLGSAVSHHDLSHMPVPVAAHAVIDAWYLEQFVHLVERLRQTPDPLGGSLLDTTLVVYTSSMGDGATHSPVDMDFLLAGGQLGGRGEHRRAVDGTTVSDLWLGVLRALGIEQARFGYDGTEPFDLG
jgi:hypothetical protein